MGDGWEFWIDVGGTFTDCMARDPTGRIHTHKLLSTGVYRGIVDKGSNRRTIRSHSGPHGSPGFFKGCQIRLVPCAAHPQAPTTIADFDPSSRRIELAEDLEADPTIGGVFEISSGEEAPVVGIRWILGRRLDEPIGPCSVRLGTTRGTNALLERRGARVGLIVTKGFRDLLEIGNQDRPRLFDLAIRKPRVLYTRVAEVDELLDARGQVLRALEQASVDRALAEFREHEIESIAICLKHSYLNGAHEEQVAAMARARGFAQVSLSSRLSPTQRMVPRCETAVVDGYLSPVIREYVRSIRASLPEARLLLMTSSGSLVESDEVAGKDVILSGPAGGVVAARHIAERGGFASAIAFDMGGTSTDVSRQEGPPQRRHLLELRDPDSGGHIRIVAPMLAIETVAAGGGSICDFQEGRVTVGPRSAGADPGPACYGRGGPLTITDCNFFLGRLVEESFSIPLDRSSVNERLDELIREIESSSARLFDSAELAAGFLSVANLSMASAIKRISVARGHDPRGDVLVSFGGAGGQHACAVAELLGIRSVIQHAHAGLLSALGIGLADIRKFAERHIGKILSLGTLDEIRRAHREMLADLYRQLVAEGVRAHELCSARATIELRYRGQDATISIEIDSTEANRHRGGGQVENAARTLEADDLTSPSTESEIEEIRCRFQEAHAKLYGFHLEHRPLEILLTRLEWGTRNPPLLEASPTQQKGPPTVEGRVRAYFKGKWRDTNVYAREKLGAGAQVTGPAIILESSSTIVVEPGWTAEVRTSGELLLTLQSQEPPPSPESEGINAVSLELFANRFRAIAEEMGATLQRTAISTNVKERLDFSCAIFDGAGRLIVNAPHVPVHLGAMGETIRCLREEFPRMAPGDVYVTNDPFRGGSHLPDVTVVTPVFAGIEEQPHFFVANRAHHAEIGGIVPGSMPPFAKNLDEEGVLIPPFRLRSSRGREEDRLRALLSSGKWPSRSVDENIADIHAQVAANQTGMTRLLELAERHGADQVLAFMDELRRVSAMAMRRRLAAIPEGTREFGSALDDGSVIRLRLTISHGDGASATFDFTGTSGPSPTNLNANPAIARSAILYSLRCLIGEDIPLNDGVMEPITVRIPEGALLNPMTRADPRERVAVGGGNVETSQRIVDVVLGALGIAAASQGTMNNLLFGKAADERGDGFGYYETIGGGAGAGPGFAGASGVHTHMTNTRITDPEVLEARYPVRLREFSIRAGSGGTGQWRGGDGLNRVIEFLDRLEVSIVSNRRRTEPFGLAGGGAGAPGKNLVIHADGWKEDLGPFAQWRTEPGDVLYLKTPGGGGYGPER